MGDTGSSPEVIEGRATALIAEKYRVLRVLGEGATGTVYLCEHQALEKQVAVKVLRRELADNADLVTRFQREAQTAARLDHPSSVHVMDFGQDKEGNLYLAMEYVQGRDLAELLNDSWPLDDARVVHIMSCVLSALSAAHALGIVHRDLKPENILVHPSDDPSAPDVVKVCDFGIAQLSPIRLARSDRPSTSMVARVTGEGMVVGTPWYMSPEQARAETLDARSDLYSAGVVLFQLLTRTLPFMAESAVAVAVMHCTTPPPPPSGYGPVHPGLESVCLRALSKTREARFQSAAEMLAALKSAVEAPAPTRLLARRSRPTPVPPVRALPSGDRESLSSAATLLSTPAVRLSTPAPERKRRTSLLVAAVCACVLGIAALPQFLPRQHEHAHAKPASAEAAVPDSASMSVPAAPSDSEPVLESIAAAASSSEAPDAIAPSAQATATAQAAPRAARPAAPREAARPRKPELNAAPSAPQAPELQQTPVPEKLHAAVSAPVLPLEAAKAIEPKPELLIAPTPAAEPVAAPVPSAPIEAAQPPAAVSVKPAAPSPAAVSSSAPAQPPAAVSSDPAHARVTLVSERASSGVARSSLRAALNVAALTRCYQDALRGGEALGRNLSVSLDITTNLGGRVIAAHVADGLPRGLGECMEQVARSGQVRGGEVGEVRATFGLKLER